ncbi:MAG: rod shape-determining protein RodA [Bdellovibrionota bacterium]
MIGTPGLQVEGRNIFRRVDWNLAGVIVALNVIGLINLFSATHGHGEIGGSDRLFWSQLFWLISGWSLYFVVTVLDYNLILRLAYVFYAINLVALVAVIFVGKVALGAQRWLDFGFFSYQPSESMKVALVLVLAKFMSQKSYPDGLGFKEMALPLVLIAIPFLITAEQPDLGTAMMILAIGGSVLFFLKIKRKILVSISLVMALAGTGAWFFALHDYQRDRVYTFLDPARDPRGKGYNSIQSKIAVGSGKFVGKGFRKGTQSQLELLPERHTDFIFSVLSEEFGFVGSLMTVILFAVLFLFGVRVASQARDKAGAILTVGIMAMLFWHHFVNISMVIGLLPIVGIPLPLLSYGGTSMLTTMAALGLVSSVSYRKHMF